MTPSLLPIARTLDEAHLYLDLTPCSACASTATDWQHGQAVIDGQWVSAYDGVCATCDTEREYFFGLPPQEFAGEFPNFGGPEPSELLDAGSWLALADQLTTNLPVHDPVAAGQARTIAAAAVAEALKFIPPGEDAVPEGAFRSAEGRRVYDAEPGRFRRDRLQFVLEAYQGRSDSPRG